MIPTDQSGRRTGGRWTLRRLTAGAALLAAPLAACNPDEILDVEDIDVALPETVTDSAALPSVLAGAIGNFQVAYNGNTALNQVTLAGQLSDELINTETFPTRIEIDQRRQQYESNGTLSTLFYETQQARAAADLAAGGYAQFAPEAVGHAEALNLSALTYIIMAENYCAAVPISRETTPGVFEYGPALSTAELFETAVRKADSALAITASTAAGTGSAAQKTDQARLARIVKARALLNLDRPAEAATAIGGATGVPTTYQYVIRHSETTGRQNNGTWALTINVGRFGVADREGGNGLPFRSEGEQSGTLKDPRTPNLRLTGRNAFGFDPAIPIWRQQKYASRDTLVVVADGVEARLIEAEAALRAGTYTDALTALNALRSNAALLTLRSYAAGSLPPLAAAVGATAQQDQLFKERAYWLFLTSHRLGDLRRLVRQYGRGAETVFPAGTYHRSGTYGTDVNSPIPQAEENNPEFDRAACVATEA
jgi:hypothetical protein